MHYTGAMVKSPNELTPETLIKRVMSGTKEYRSQAYLEAFSNLNPNLLKHPALSRFEVIKLWNSLHNSPSKVRYFTFSLVNNNHHVIKFIEANYKDAKWAYILHDKDISAEHKHYHYVLMFPSPRSFNSVANDLEIPVTMLQKVYSKKGILDYLTHENDPNKYHYPLGEIHANFDVQEEKDKDDKDGKIDPWQEFCDFCDMKEGRMSMREWFDKYHDILCDIKCEGI